MEEQKQQQRYQRMMACLRKPSQKHAHRIKNTKRQKAHTNSNDLYEKTIKAMQIAAQTSGAQVARR